MAADNTIYWSLDYRLKLSDFKKESDERNRHAFSSIGYEIEPKIRYNEERTRFFIGDISLKTFFLRNRSFFNHEMARADKISQKTIDGVILHEQGHFDMSEEIRPRIAREIASRCKGKVFHASDSDLNEIDDQSKANTFVELIYRSALMDEAGTFRRAHHVYDRETNHGKIRRKQAEYNVKFRRFRKTLSQKNA